MMTEIFSFIFISSLLYMWILPACIAGILKSIVEDAIVGKIDKLNFIGLGVVLTMMIIPMYCWHFLW